MRMMVNRLLQYVVEGCLTHAYNHNATHQRDVRGSLQALEEQKAAVIVKVDDEKCQRDAIQAHIYQDLSIDVRYLLVRLPETYKTRTSTFCWRRIDDCVGWKLSLR